MKKTQKVDRSVSVLNKWIRSHILVVICNTENADDGNTKVCFHQ